MATAPAYIKRNSMIGMALILPFVVCAILMNTLVAQPLLGIQPWTSIMYAGIVILPTVGGLIGLITLFYWRHQTHTAKSGNEKRLHSTLQYGWPLLLVAVIGLGILAFDYGHDSVHCVTDNPTQAAAHWHQTIQCIMQS